MPTSLDSHPPPLGAPDPGQAHRLDLFAGLRPRAKVSRVIRQHKRACAEPSTLSPCLVYAIAPNAWDRKQPSRMGTDLRPGGRTHVAARLSDIERCIFGSRLSLMTLPEGLDKKQSQPSDGRCGGDPSSDTGRGNLEANHPWHTPPASVLHIYSMVLHHLRMYGRGDWYRTLVAEGKCHLCHRPLVDDLRTNFSELLDSDGCIDIVVIRDRKSVEEPELTNVSRSHEIYV
ncbi:hypothetical protein F4818DRAFT_455702 [Hypoxylon cercidicola]|nr:hypothetical protein F4818DRAFT_455702 [Hypoxylon cercidicola]